MSKHVHTSFTKKENIKEFTNCHYIAINKQKTKHCCKQTFQKTNQNKTDNMKTSASVMHVTVWYHWTPTLTKVHEIEGINVSWPDP